MLVKLFYDYVHDPVFREEFQKDPSPFLRKLGVSAEELELLRARDREALMAALHRESDQLLTKALEIETTDPTYYPITTPAPDSIVPPQGPVNTRIDFTILGSGLVSVSKVVFFNGQKFPAKDLKIVNNSKFGSELTGNVELPEVGLYEVLLEPQNNTPPVPVPGNFIAV
jgi:hypothetical protein